MGAYHAVLISGGRRPGVCSLVYIKAAEGDIIHSGFGGHKAVAAHIDIHFFLVGVMSLEIGINHRGIAFLLGIPFINGEIMIPGRGIYLTLDAFLKSLGFIQLAVI